MLKELSKERWWPRWKRKCQLTFGHHQYDWNPKRRRSYFSKDCTSNLCIPNHPGWQHFTLSMTFRAVSPAPWATVSYPTGPTGPTGLVGDVRRSRPSNVMLEWLRFWWQNIVAGFGALSIRSRSHPTSLAGARVGSPARGISFGRYCTVCEWRGDSSLPLWFGWCNPTNMVCGLAIQYASQRLKTLKGRRNRNDCQWGSRWLFTRWSCRYMKGWCFGSWKL